MVEMVSADLEQLFTGAFLEPLREPRVLLCARLLGQPRVRDLPDQHVLEAEGRLAGDRGTLLAKHELPQQQVVEQRLHVEVRRDVLDSALPEDPADDSRSLQQYFGIWRQVIDTRSDERLQRVGNTIVVAALGEHANGLLDEQRVAFRSIEQALGQGRRIRQVGDESGDELVTLLLGQRLELDGGRPHAASAPAWPHVEQVRSREAEDQQRRAHPVGDVLDEVEHRLLGPVDVLEEEDERLHVGKRAHDLAGGPRDLLRAALALDSFQEARSQADQVGDSIVFAAGAELLERLFERLVVRDPDRRLDHLGERPVRHAFAVRQAAALEHARAVHGVDELAHEPALADARLAVDREEVRAAVTTRSLVRVLEQLQLGLATDERGADVDVSPVDGADHAPGAHRRAHAFQLERSRVLDDEPPPGEAVGRRTDEDLSRHRGLL